MFRKKVPKTELATYGSGLIQEFASVQANTSMAEGLKYEAELSERMALGEITATAPHNNIYITPGDIPSEQQSAIARNSVNAHVQKAQAMQVAAYTDQQVKLAEAQAKEKYKSLKVTIQVLSQKPWPIDTFWKDQRGQYHLNEHGPKKITGYIEDIDLKKNYIIIQPTRLFKAVNNSIAFHRVYVIAPDTMQPLISITVH